MSILSGFFKTKRYRKTADGYKLESNWTSGNTVELDDGNTVQNNVGAIKGITTSTSVTEEGYAADATTVAALNNSLGDISKSELYKTFKNLTYKDIVITTNGNWVQLIKIDSTQYLVSVVSLTANVRIEIILGDNRYYYIRCYSNNDVLLSGTDVNIRVFYGKH